MTTTMMTTATTDQKEMRQMLNFRRRIVQLIRIRQAVNLDVVGVGKRNWLCTHRTANILAHFLLGQLLQSFCCVRTCFHTTLTAVNRRCSCGTGPWTTLLAANRFTSSRTRLQSGPLTTLTPAKRLKISGIGPLMTIPTANWLWKLNDSWLPIDLKVLKQNF